MTFADIPSGSSLFLDAKHGLLCGDALIVAVMQERGLTDLASNDADFDRVPALVR
jgi:predicted nucleic acid-binding protein